MTTLFHRVLGNLLSGLAGSVIMAVSQLALIAFIVARVELDVYGAALLLVAVFDILELLRRQLGRPTFKYLAEHVSGPRGHTLNQIMSSCFALHIITGVLILGLCWGLVPFLESWFTMPAALVPQATMALRISGVVVGLGFLVQPQVQLVAALERMDLVMGTQVVGRLARLGLTIAALLVWDQQILGIVLSILAGDLLAQLLGLWLAHRLFGWVPMKLSLVSGQWIKRILRFNLFDSLHSVSEILFRHLALFLAAQFISLGAVAQLRVLFTVARMVLIVAIQPGEILVPTASRLFASGETEKLRRGVLTGITATVFMSCLVMVMVVPWLHWLLALWVGRDFVPLTYLGQLFLLGAFLRYSLSALHGALAGRGDVVWDGLSDLASAVLGLGTSLVLVTFFGANLTNFAIGLFFCDFLRWAMLLGYGCRVFKVPMLHVLGKSYLRAVALAVLFIAGIYWLNIPAPNWPRLVVFCGISGILYGSLAFFLVLPLDIRERLYEMGSDLWRAVAARRGR